jgi:hypothetical protein
MKSILAKQAPHRRPWLPMRARHEKQTGGKSRAAMWPSSERIGFRQAVSASRDGSAAALSSTPVMGTMIEPEKAALEGRKRFIP